MENFNFICYIMLTENLITRSEGRSQIEGIWVQVQRRTDGYKWVWNNS